MIEKVSFKLNNETWELYEEDAELLFADIIRVFGVHKYNWIKIKNKEVYNIADMAIIEK